MIATRTCGHCRRAQPASASFCGACGFEFEAPSRARELPPPVPSVERRVGVQGRAAIRQLLAFIAILVAAIPIHLMQPGVTAEWLLLDAGMAAVVLGCVAAERGALAPALLSSGRLWLLIAVPIAFVLQWSAALYFSLLEAQFEDAQVGMLEEGIPGWLLLVSVVAMPAVFEELAFRGVFLRSAQHFLRPLAAHTLTAGVFAAIHFDLLSFPFLFALGLALGFLRARSGSLWPAVVLHGFNNAWAVGLLPGGPQ